MKRDRARRFATHVQNPWEDWERYWLREVKLNAEGLCIRIPGLVARDRGLGLYDQNDADVLTWERMVRRVYGQDCRRLATVILPFIHHSHPHWPLRKGPPMRWGRRIYRLWASLETLHHRLDYMLRLLKSEVQRPILVHVEDFSARWVLRTRFQPDRWMIDNPMICWSELDLWGDRLLRPGLIRRSLWERLEIWDEWRMHFSPEELIAAHLPSRGVHGRWYSTSLQPFNLRDGRTIIDQLAVEHL